MGPPGVGKSTIAQQLAKEYKLHHIHVKDVIAQTIDNLNKLAKRAEAGGDGIGPDKQLIDGEEEEEEEIEEEEDLPDLEELETINENMESNNGKLCEHYAP